MKILYSSELNEADRYTIQHEPTTPIKLMERAALGISDWLLSNRNPYHLQNKKLVFFCGTGNNGADGLCVAYNLRQICDIHIYIVYAAPQVTSEFGYALDKLKNTKSDKKLTFSDIFADKDIPDSLGKYDLCVDAIFGIGLNKPAKTVSGRTIDKINEAKMPVISIDIPSGLFPERNEIAGQKHIIYANYTLALHSPKVSFFIDENLDYLGKVELIDIGLHPTYLKDAYAHFHTIDDELIKKNYKPRPRGGHKGTFGHGLLIVGSEGKMGAAVLAAKGYLRSGAGMVTVQAPKGGGDILQTAVPEAIVRADESNDKISVTFPDLDKYKSIGIGCGLGTAEATRNAVLKVLASANKPLVIDADALNIIAENRNYLFQIPKKSILTPHPKEFDRMFGKAINPFDRIVAMQHITRKYDICMILKGAHAVVCLPDNSCWINITGNSGMATAGSGDVLTGLLTGLLAQGYESDKACMLGVYIHGLAGDLAAADYSKEGIIAGDIAQYIGKAFAKLA